MSEFLKVTRNGQILEIVLDRPKANAIDAALSRSMGELFADFRDDPECSLVGGRLRLQRVLNGEETCDAVTAAG